MSRISDPSIAACSHVHFGDFEREMRRNLALGSFEFAARNCVSSHIRYLQLPSHIPSPPPLGAQAQVQAAARVDRLGHQANVGAPLPPTFFVLTPSTSTPFLTPPSVSKNLCGRIPLDSTSTSPPLQLHPRLPPPSPPPAQPPLQPATMRSALAPTMLPLLAQLLRNASAGGSVWRETLGTTMHSDLARHQR